MLATKVSHSPELVAAVATTVVILSLLAHHAIHKKREKWDDSQQLPLPQLPPFAHTTMLQTLSALSKGEHPWFFQKLQKELLPIKLFRLPMPKILASNWIIIGDAKIATKILQDSKTKRPTIGYEDIDKCIGGGPSLPTMDGDGWKHRRLATNVAFASHNLKRMGKIANARTKDWMEDTLERSGNDVEGRSSFDVHKEMVRLTITIILEAALEYTATKTEADYLANEFLLVSLEFTKQSGGQNPFRQLFGRVNKEMKRARQAKHNVFSFAQKIVAGYREKTHHNDTGETTLLRCIMENSKYKNDDERASDIVMWMYAGFDNTGCTIAFTLLDLARNPMVVASLRDELKKVPKDEWHKSTPIRNIVKESMRLHPAAPGGAVRLTGKDFVFGGINMIVPENSIVQVPNILYTRDEDVFDSPNEFQPNRWNEKNKAQSMTDTFLPFLAGRLNCAGQALANVELEVVISCLLQEYDFKVDLEGKEEFFITLKPVGARLTATKV